MYERLGIIVVVLGMFWAYNLSIGSIDEEVKSDWCKRIDSIEAAEFFREYVSKGVPVIITKQTTQAYDKIIKGWQKKDYFQANFGSTKIQVSMSPNGEFEFMESNKEWPSTRKFWDDFNAENKDYRSHLKEVLTRNPKELEKIQWSSCDSNKEDCIRFTMDRTLVRPATTTSTLKEFLESVSGESENKKFANPNISYYIQYDKMPQELHKNLKSPTFAKNLNYEFTGLWYGIGPTRANLHYDRNENLMLMISGTKKWTLFEPNDSDFLYEGYCKEGKLKLKEPADKDSPYWRLERDSEPSKKVDLSYFSSPIDIKNPNFDRFPRFRKASPKICHLRAGEMLYLPSFWWHDVETVPDENNRGIAVNFWYLPYKTKDIACPNCTTLINRMDYFADPVF